MNEPQETPPKDKDKKSTKEVSRDLMHLAAAHEANNPQPETDGDDMPVEPELHDVERRVRQLESYRAYAEDRLTRHTQRLDSHDLRLDGIMSREQLSALIDDKFHLQYESIDAAYARAEKLVNELTTQFSANITAQHNILVQMKTIQDAGNERNTLLNTVVSALSIMAGYDIKDPQARKIGSSVFEMAKEAVDAANRAEDDVANMRIDVAGVAIQFRGWQNQAKAIEAQLARAEEADRIAAAERQKWQEFREVGFKLMTHPRTLALIVGSLGGGGSFALVLKALGVF